MTLMNKVSVVIIFLLLTTTFIYYITPVKRSLTNESCSAFLNMRDQKSDFSGYFNVFLFFHENNSGYFDMDGDIIDDGEIYKIARSYSFKYEIKSGSLLCLQEVKLSKRAADNAPEKIVDKQIFSNNSSGVRYMKICSLKNAFLVSNLYSPLFVCEVE